MLVVHALATIRDCLLGLQLVYMICYTHRPWPLLKFERLDPKHDTNGSIESFENAMRRMMTSSVL